MTDREIWQAIAARLQTLITAAQELAQFVQALASEAERSAGRIRELAGKSPQQVTGNGGTGKRRGRPPSNTQPTPEPAADIQTPAALDDSDVRIARE